jgi:hypothetical protein
VLLRPSIFGVMHGVIGAPGAMVAGTYGGREVGGGAVVGVKGPQAVANVTYIPQTNA